MCALGQNINKCQPGKNQETNDKGKDISTMSQTKKTDQQVPDFTFHVFSYLFPHHSFKNPNSINCEQINTLQCLRVAPATIHNLILDFES